jgi:hypothetical protein
MSDIASIRPSDGTEDPKGRAPWESFVLAYAAMVPVVAGSVAAWVLADGDGMVADLTSAWAGGVVCFLAGVRRGLSFRQEGGPTLAQLAAMLWLFVLGVGSLLLPWLVVALGLQIAGFATMAVLDPVAARRREVPRYFARLRPVQMLVPIVALAALLVRVSF